MGDNHCCFRGNMEMPTDRDSFRIEAPIECCALSTTHVVDLADWCVGPDQQSLEKRSDIIHAIAHCQRSDFLQVVINQGWDAEEILLIPHIPDHPTPGDMGRSKNTAFQYFIQKSWIEGIKILLDAGYNVNSSLKPYEKSPLECVITECETNAEEVVSLLLDYGEDPNTHYDEMDSTLENALRNRGNDCEHIVKLLIEHGAKVRCEDRLGSIMPLVLSLLNSFVSLKTIRMLLENGADPTIVSGVYHWHPYDGFVTPLSAALLCLYKAGFEGHPKTKDADEETTIMKIRELIKYGAEINHCSKEAKPPLHALVGTGDPHDQFYLKTLNFLYNIGCDVEMSWEDCGTALQHAVNTCSHPDNLRWLVRHGASTQSLNLEDKILFYNKERRKRHLYNYIQNILFLVMTGLQLPKSDQFLLEQMGISAEDTLSKAGNEIYEGSLLGDQCKWISQLTAAIQDNQRKDKSRKHSTSNPEPHKHQANNLEEFSDESINIFTEDNFDPSTNTEFWKTIQSKIQDVLDYLRQPQTLAWYCRQCVRQNIVSLLPCIVRRLPFPSALKCYILCHNL